MSLQRLGWFCLVCALGAVLLVPGVFHAAPQASGYRVIRNVLLGGDGGWDYVTLDADAKRVYIPRGTHVITALVADGLLRVANGEIQDLRWQVETFGFHLADLEVRQHSAIQAAALKALQAGSPEQADDMTVIVMRFPGTSEERRA